MRLLDVRNEEFYKIFKKALIETKGYCGLTDEEFAMANAELIVDGGMSIVHTVALCDTIIEYSNNEELKEFITKTLNKVDEYLQQY